MAKKPIDEDEIEDTEEEDDTPPPPSKPINGLSTPEIDEKMLKLNLEWQELRGDVSGAALARRSEISGQLRTLRKLRIAKAPKVRVQVPATPTGHPIHLGPKTFWPGNYEVTVDVAADLTWIIDQQQRAEMARMQQNGRTIDVSDPQSRVRALLAE